MTYLYIYAYPVQMLAFQLMQNDKVQKNSYHVFNNVIPATKQYLDNNNIDTIRIVGSTEYANKIEQLITINFKGRVNIERIQRD